MATDPKSKPVRWEYDLHEMEFVARGHPLPVPATGIFDETLHCALINVQWLPHIIGALQILVEGDSWSGGDDELFRAQQEIMKLISSLSNPCSDGGGGGTVLIPEFRTIAIDARCDQNQWKYTVEPTTAWRNLGTQICDGIDGENGEPAPPGEDGREIEVQTVNLGDGCFQIQWRYQGESAWTDSGDPVCCACEETVPINPVEPEEMDGLECSIAINMTKELRRIVDVSYEDEQDLIGIVLGGSGTVASIAALIFSGIGTAAGIAAAFFTAFQVMHAFFVAGESNAFNDAAETRLRCYLYCILLAHAGVEIDASIIEEWAVQIESDTVMGEQRFAIALLLRSSPIEQFQWIAYASSEVDSAACDCGCGEWCHLIDLTATDGGFSAISSNGQWISGQGWKQSSVQGQFNITMDFPASGHVTSVRTVVSSGAAAGGVSLRAPFATQNSPNGSTDHTFTVDDTVSALGLAFDSNFAGTPNPSWGGALNLVEIRGTGENPFGEDNC